MKIKNLIYMCLLLCGLISCKRVVTFFHDKNVVAKVGNHKLFKSEVVSYIPDDISSKDSVALAERYINSWILNYKLLNLAENELSDKDKDVKKELEDYRVSLLKFRYEQRYVNQRLDTTVTNKEITNYYKSHQDLFYLDIPILKVRFVRIAEDSPNKDKIVGKLSSENEDDISEIDSLAYSSALKFTSYGNNWIDARSLAGEFDIDYTTLMSKIDHNYIKLSDGRGNINVAYVFEVQNKGKVGSEDYFRKRIKDIILSARKQKLIEDLEKEILLQSGE